MVFIDGIQHDNDEMLSSFEHHNLMDLQTMKVCDNQFAVKHSLVHTA